jgi:hypothetical protein
LGSQIVRLVAQFNFLLKDFCHFRVGAVHKAFELSATRTMSRAILSRPGTGAMPLAIRWRRTFVTVGAARSPRPAPESTWAAGFAWPALWPAGAETGSARSAEIVIGSTTTRFWFVRTFRVTRTRFWLIVVERELRSSWR